MANNSLNTPPHYLPHARQFQRKIEHLLQSTNIRSITLDIFDTVLYRRIWPEEKQFYIVAQRWLPVLRSAISPDLTTDEIWSWRIYARNELLDVKNTYPDRRQTVDKVAGRRRYDVTLDDWFRELIQLLAIKHHQQLSQRTIAQLSQQMVTIELQTELENLSPNRQLICLIKQLKQQYGLKVSFISDMYLTTDQIKSLLDRLNIDIFDDGISSVDLGYGKYDSRAYSVIHNQHILGGDFDISHNLHIGDNQYADVQQALFAGSSALLWHRPRLRRIRTKLGALQVHKINHQIVRHDAALYKSLLTKRDITPNQIWQKFGILFSQPLYDFILHVGIAARQCPHTTFLMVSSEAKEFYRKGQQLFPDLFSNVSNIVVADKLNRRCVFRAYAYLLATSPTVDCNAESIFASLCMGEMQGQRRELYEFFFDKNYPYSELNINTQSDKDFFKAFIQNIRHATPQQIRQLQKAYDYTRQFYPVGHTELVITDVGWGGTIQAILREILHLEGINNKVSGLYIGDHFVDRCGIKPIVSRGYLMSNVFSKDNHPIWNAVIWEYAYTNKAQFPEDKAHLEQIAVGFQQGESLFGQMASNPLYAFTKVTRPQLQRLISHPTQDEIRIIGNINFDFGFVDEGRMPLANTSTPLVRFWLQLLRHPRRTLHNVIFAQNVWSAAYFKYYHLGILKPAIWIWSKIRRRSYM